MGTYKSRINKIENEIIHSFNSFIYNKREERLGEEEGDKERLELENTIQKDHNKEHNKELRHNIQLMNIPRTTKQN